MMLYSDAVQADAELATGLVELKVGLMPSAGGTTEMLARALARLPAGADAFEAVTGVFALITEGRVSGSALEARRLGFLRETDGITMNRRRLPGRCQGKGARSGRGRLSGARPARNAGLGCRGV